MWFHTNQRFWCPKNQQKSHASVEHFQAQNVANKINMQEAYMLETGGSESPVQDQAILKYFAPQEE